ncbi:hypothetical protein CUU63_10155 [Bacillus halotolerans]|uniref:Uncharacterized protein n=1 Tax=Bacillus halotolerans TaxID=260554 RepID=A0A9Q6F277_9BACI|nr:hypothetical protein CUU63_10155 [Bacillus halotolerans]
MKILKISPAAIEAYRNDVKRNYDIEEDQARRKLTRNVMLVKEFRPEAIKKGFISKTYSYGNLKIIVRHNTIIKVRNIKGDPEPWHFPKKRYIELNKLLGIRDCKFSSKSHYRNNKNKNKI